MTLARIAEILAAETLVGENPDRLEISAACGSDLMSDVLCFSKSRSLLLTGLTNPQAEMSEIAAVCFVRGKRPPAETLALAQKNRIPLLLTQHSMYSACGLLWAAGLQGCNDQC